MVRGTLSARLSRVQWQSVPTSQRLCVLMTTAAEGATTNTSLMEQMSLTNVVRNK